MRVLFVMNTPGFLRYYDTTIALLLERGHDVALAFTNTRLRPEALEALPAHPRLTVLGEAGPRTDAWARTASDLRVLVDFARYLDPVFADTAFLRDRRRVRVLRELPGWYRLLGERDTLPRPLARALVRTLLAAERAIPSAREVEALLRGWGPDVLLVSPLVVGGSSQTDYVKSARALGLPSALCVASWDNLTNKGLVREVPDRVMVWNAAQRDEAVALHDVPPGRVVVTGAQPFDRWFGRAPTATRAEFCARVGLDPDRPYVLFAGSTSNITDPGAEDLFVRRWIEALRAAPDPALAGLGVLVRPHPDRRGAWGQVDLTGIENAVVWPSERPNSVTAGARGDYFDSLFHSAAIVGINTSAMVEGAILDRPVLTVRLPQFAEAHAGTLHFRHLLPEHGGFLFVASDLPAHGRQLAALLRDPAEARARNRAFVQRFIRPGGMQRPATPILADAIEATAALAPVPPPGVAALPLRALLRAAAEVRRRAPARRASAPPAPLLDRAAPVLAGLDALAAELEGTWPGGAGRVRGLGRRARRRLRAHDKQRHARDRAQRRERRDRVAALRRDR